MLKQIRNTIALVGLGAVFLLFATRPFLPLGWQSMHGVLAMLLLVVTFGSILVLNRIATGRFLPGVPAGAVSRPSKLARNDRDRKLAIATGLAVAGVGLVQFFLTKELHWSRSIAIGIAVCLITAIVVVSYRLRMNNLNRPL
jgi:hypothetical protein